MARHRVDARAVGSLGVTMPGREITQRELIDLIIVFGVDTVGVGLAVLAQQDKWRGVGSLRREQ
jgi:hypothetical protein